MVNGSGTADTFGDDLETMIAHQHVRCVANRRRWFIALYKGNVRLHLRQGIFQPLGYRRHNVTGILVIPDDFLFLMAGKAGKHFIMM